VVLSRAQVKRLLRALERPVALMTLLMYGAGPRILECCHLHLKDVDFERHQILVRGGEET
jgi:integrase